MAGNSLKRKYGVVILLDALGASTFTDSQIRQFLTARSKINAFVKDYPNFVKNFSPNARQDIGKFSQPVVFTFADTVIVTIALRSKKYISRHILFVSILMRRYLFHSLQAGIMFRGAFSIGDYIEDASSNTVMGPAVTDAAAWYDQFACMGLSCTPKTNSVLEYYEGALRGQNTIFGYMQPYDVPLKDGGTSRLFTINWPSAFFDKGITPADKHTNPSKYFVEILKRFDVPKGVETKFEHTKKYFASIIEEKHKMNHAGKQDGAGQS